MKRPYIITGDRGFVGRRLRRALLSAGEQGIGISRRPADQPGNASYEPLALDLADRAAVYAMADRLREAEGVFHLAAQLPKSDADPLEPHLSGNLRTTENLLAVLHDADVPLVLSATMSVFGLPPDRIPVDEDQLARPVESYGVTKLLAEDAARHVASRGHVPCAILRYPGIFGQGYEYGAIHYYARQALAGEPISVYGGGRIVRDYVHVDDIVTANRLALQAARNFRLRLYHIGGGEPMELARLAGLVSSAAGDVPVETNDRVGPMDFAFDITRARAELGYEPQPLSERIAQYMAELQGAQEPSPAPSAGERGE